jgi:hypothetical protein
MVSTNPYVVLIASVRGPFRPQRNGDQSAITLRIS